MAIRLSTNRLDLGSASLTNAEMRGWSETVNALGNATGATTIDLSLGNVVTATTTGATVWTVTNASSSQASSFTLILTNGGSQTQAWMSGTQWVNGSNPTLNSSGTDVLTFFTTDAGTTWRGAKGGPAPQDQTGQKLFVWGNNSYGRFGLGDTFSRSSPTQLMGQWRRADIHGATYFMGIRPNGSLYASGANSGGTLGLGDTINRSSPVQVPGTWSLAITGTQDTLALKADNSLWVWGAGGQGRLGLGDTIKRSSPVQLAGTWVAIGVGGPYHCGGIKSDGSLWMWGRNGVGALGLGLDGSSLYAHSSPVQVSGTWTAISLNLNNASSATRADGSIWTWGQNNGIGNLAQGDVIQRSSPTQVPGTWRSMIMGGGGGYFSAIRQEGSFWTCGGDNQGQLGLGDTVYRSSPTQVAGTWVRGTLGGTQMAALKANGDLFVAGGSTAFGSLGLGDTTKRSSPVQLAGTWTNVDVGTGTPSMLGFKV